MSRIYSGSRKSSGLWIGLVLVGGIAVLTLTRHASESPSQPTAPAALSPAPGATARLTPAELQRQVREQLSLLMTASQPEVVQKSAQGLQQLIAHATPAGDGESSRQAILAHLLQGRLQWIGEQSALVQERDSLLATWHQSDLAVEMIIGPLCGGDPYIKAVYSHYHQYAGAVSAGLESLFANRSLGQMQQQIHQVTAMETIMQDDLRVLALESPALRDHAQFQAGLHALQTLMLPEQGVLDRWFMLQQHAGLLRVSAGKLQQLMMSSPVTADRKLS